MEQVFSQAIPNLITPKSLLPPVALGSKRLVIILSVPLETDRSGSQRPITVCLFYLFLLLATLLVRALRLPHQTSREFVVFDCQVLHYTVSKVTRQVPESLEKPTGSHRAPSHDLDLGNNWDFGNGGQFSSSSLSD